MSLRDTVRDLLDINKFVYKLDDGSIAYTSSLISHNCRHLKHVLNTLDGGKRAETLGEKAINITKDNIDEHVQGTQIIDNSYTKAANYICPTLNNYIKFDASDGGFISSSAPAKPKVTTYLMLDNNSIYTAAKTIANMGNTLPMDRVVIGFFRPDSNYNQIISNTNFDFSNVGFGGDGFDISLGAFRELVTNFKTNIGPNGQKVQVYLSMGGWNFNCFPKLAQNSHSHSNSTYWKTGGDNPPSVSNMFHNVCSPSGLHMGAYTFFPDPCSRDAINDASDVWKGWSMKLEPGTTVPTKSIPKWQWLSSEDQDSTYVDAENTKCSHTKVVKCSGQDCVDCVKLTGNDVFNNIGLTTNLATVGSDEIIGNPSDPTDKSHAITIYDSFVHFAYKCGADGIDIDYEEFWHADTFKCSNCGPALLSKDPGSWKLFKGPYMFSQTKGKFARIVSVFKKAIQIYSQKYKSHLYLSIPSPPVGMNETRYGNTSWYSGNLKGFLLNDEACGEKYPFKCDLDNKNCKISYKDKCATSIVEWFNWQKQFIKLNALSQISSDTTYKYSFWNEIFDGGIFPMIYDFGGGVLTETGQWQWDDDLVGVGGNYECGPPHSNLHPSSSDSNAITDGWFRPPGISPSRCDLISQLKFYSDQYIDNSLNISLGFEVGMPNFPRADDAGNNKLDINNRRNHLIAPNKEYFNPDNSNNITNFFNKDKFNSNNHDKYKYGVFFWEMFKGIPNTDLCFNCVKCDFSYIYKEDTSYKGYPIGTLNDTACTSNKMIDLSGMAYQLCKWGGGTDSSCTWDSDLLDAQKVAIYDQNRDCCGNNW